VNYLLGTVKREKPEPGPWNDARARERLAEAYAWAERTGHPGMWSWLWRVGHDRLPEMLNESFDLIDEAFRTKDHQLLNVALRGFRGTVTSATAMYRGGSPPGWYGPDPGQPELRGSFDE
jgi:hypothetical protein